MDERGSRPSRWQQLTGGTSGEEYAARFAAAAATGKDMHGEATLCAALVPEGSRVLDAGCGTGRVAVRLAELGYDCVGTDVDDSMLAVARAQAPDIPWVAADLAELTAEDLGTAGPGAGAPFDLVVMAGNVVPLLAEGTLDETVARLAGLLAPGGLLVAGFGLDPAHLPPGCPVTPLADYDAACAAAGLALADRFATWDRDPFPGADPGYAVSLHRPHPAL